VNRLWSLARRYGLDALIVFAALEGAVEVLVRQDSEGAPQTTAWFAAPATALIILPLLARRRFPFAAPAAVWLIGAACSFVDGLLVVFTTSVFIAGMAASYLLGGLRDSLQAPLGLAIVLGGAATVTYNKPDHTAAELIFIPLLFAIGWLAGFALRERADEATAAEVRAAAAERERDTASRIAVAEERARIARELHDIVAHSVSVMVLQAGAIRHRLPDELADEADALKGVEQTGRSALAEMRRLLGAMHDGDSLELAPRPGLDRLDALVDDVSRAGLPVELHVEGSPFPLPEAIDLSAYRIVQEGLTNALKHAHASRADVTVRYRPDELEIEVRDNGNGTSSSDGLGHGLVGVRERVKIYGGEMTVGAAAGSGFVLTTRLPIGNES
jgi:signal transduction histidine kinase